jgi:hypothetical protein
MTLASNIAAAWTNIALTATLTASSEAAGMLVTKLQQEDTKRNWRTGATTTASVLATYSTNQSADTFFMANTNLTAAGIARVRLSSTDATGAAGDIWDSNPTSVPGQVDPNYKDALILASSVKSGFKYERWDLTDTSLTYLEAGFKFTSTRTQFDYNYSWGDGRTRVDPSIYATTKGGQTKIKSRTPFWRWEIPMGWITQAQKNGAIEQINLLNGRKLPVLFIMNPASTNLGRDSIFGLIQDSFPVVSLQAFDSAGGIMSSIASLKVEQRL